MFERRFNYGRLPACFQQISACKKNFFFMKKQIRPYRIVRSLQLMILIALSICSGAVWAQNDHEYAIEVETEGRYLIQPGDSIHIAEAVAVYEAKKAAVELAAGYFSHKGFIEISDLDKQEVFCLSTARIEAEKLKRNQLLDGSKEIYNVLIRAKVRVTDFVLAERLEKKLETEETRTSFLEKMEPAIGPEINPGRDMARAYRMIREKKWREAVIYLDRLEKKYPGWGEIHATKALAQYSLNEPGEVKQSLIRACRLGSEKACKELRALKKLHDYDFGPGG